MKLLRPVAAVIAAIVAVIAPFVETECWLFLITPLAVSDQVLIGD